MAVRAYIPSTTPRSERVGVVLYNHGGSSVAEDTGRDAQALAEATRLAVIAADRPGSGITYPGQGRSLADDYRHAVGRHALRKILPEVQRLGLRHVVVTGRSAGGLAALVATWSDELPTAAVNAQEPIAWHERTISEGRGVLEAYYQLEKRMQADERLSLAHPDPTDQTGWRKTRRSFRNGLNFLADRHNNKHVWRQPLALAAALGIAAELPRVGIDLYFADESLVLPEGPKNSQFELATLLPEIRGERPFAAPINVEVVPNTTHSSFDLRELSNRLLLETVNRLLPPA